MPMSTPETPSGMQNSCLDDILRYSATKTKTKAKPAKRVSGISQFILNVCVCLFYDVCILCACRNNLIVAAMKRVGTEYVVRHDIRVMWGRLQKISLSSVICPNVDQNTWSRVGFQQIILIISCVWIVCSEQDAQEVSIGMLYSHWTI